jgi:hypothetical protein
MRYERPKVERRSGIKALMFTKVSPGSDNLQ